MGKKIIIGCSPGCSGSMSFAELLGMQKEIFSNHEIFLRQKGATFNEKYYYYNSWKSETSDINVFKKFIEGCYKKDLFTMAGGLGVLEHCVEMNRDTDVTRIRQHYIDLKYKLGL